MRSLRALVPIVLLLFSGCTERSGQNEILFHSGPFTVVGELRLPKGPGPHPVVVFVHGDGPNNRTSGVTYPPIMARMLRAGYATLAWDKPGTGESQGEFDPQRVIHQRAQIVLDAVAYLSQRSDVDPDRIGLWGISQAGYVMPRVLERSDQVKFMIAISCPGEPGVEQGAYLVAAQARCSGNVSTEQAAEMERRLGAVEWATTYDEYARLKTELQKIPGFMALERQGVYVGVRPSSEWHPPNLEGDYFWNPMTVIARTSIPVLAVFGEKDTQADSVQGVRAYRDALAKGGHPRSRVELIAGTDHNILKTETGCIAERNRRSSAGWRDYPEEYLQLIEDWLTGLRNP